MLTCSRWLLSPLLLALPACRGEPQLAAAAEGPPRPATTQSESKQRSLPRSCQFAAARNRMVDTQLAARDIADPRVLDAMRVVPRHWFVPSNLAARAYDDNPLPIGHDQTISQPYIVALMTQLLAVKPGDKILEIGTGSGYQAAVLSELTPHVFTIEIVEPLAERTIKLLQEKGYSDIRPRIGDGFRGWPEHSPYDGIIVTCAAPKPPQPLVDQLRVGGRMVIPVDAGDFTQELLVLTKRANGSLDRRHVAPVRFVPMTGEIKK